jgi:hypothetical protein
MFPFIKRLQSKSPRFRIFTQLIEEFLVPLILSACWTTWEYLRSTTGYSILSNGAVHFFAVGWIFSQWNRIEKQQRTETGMRDVTQTVQDLIGQLSNSTRKLEGYATGGDSYCYLERTLPSTLLPHMFSIKVQGEYTLRNVSLRVLNANRMAPDGFSLDIWDENLASYAYLRTDTDAIFSLATTDDEDFVGTEGNTLVVYADALSRKTVQHIRLIKVGTGIEWASVIICGNEILRQDISNAFPVGQDGKIDWGNFGDPTVGKI